MLQLAARIAATCGAPSPSLDGMGRPAATRRKRVHIILEDAEDSLMIDGAPALLLEFLELIGRRGRGQPDIDGESVRDGPFITLHRSDGD